MDLTLDTLLVGFTPISLKALNQKADMLERKDNKYVLSHQQLCITLQDFSEHFDVLEIDALRSFQYRTLYFDDPELSAYYQHHQRRRKRCKVRLRDYVDVGVSYLEVKLKDRRKATVKKRMPISAQRRLLQPDSLDFIESQHQQLYGESFNRPLFASLGMTYRRITLVAKQGTERLTIDANLRFSGCGQTYDVGDNTFIVETKSKNGSGLGDRVLRSRGIRPTPRCSKYCLGLIATGQVRRCNNFLRAMRSIGLYPEPLKSSSRTLQPLGMAPHEWAFN